MDEQKVKRVAGIRQLDKLAVGLVGCAAMAYVATYGFVPPFPAKSPAVKSKGTDLEKSGINNDPKA
jgi:hypothetical protein